MPLMRALYSLALWLAQPLLKRKLKRRAIREPGYGHAIEQRFGHYEQAPERQANRLIWVHAVSLGETRAAAPLGAAFTFLALVTGSLWGKPTWGTWWVWDARLTSVLVLFLFYLGYLALQAAIDDEQRAARACAILALVGAINLPIVHFSVTWWNTLHQGSSVFRRGGPTMPPVYLEPLLILSLAYMAAFGALWLVRIRGEVWRKRANALALRAAG